MTTQTIIAKYYAGQTLTASIHNRLTDADLAPAHTIEVDEITVGGGIYAVVLTGAAIVTAVTGRLKLFADGDLVDNDQLFTFAGTDGEIVDTGAAVLDSAVQDQLDAIQAAAESGGGDALESTSQLILDNVNSLIGLSGAATLPPDGYVDGITEPITIGDDYIESLNRRIVLSLIDSAGDPADTAWGDYSLDDAGISIKMLLHPSGRSTVTKSLSGDCEFVAAIGDIPAKLYVSLPRTETVKAVAGSYDLQVEAVWSDGATRTFLPFGKVNFVKDIRRT